MDQRIEELTVKLDLLHAQTEAMQQIVALLLGWESRGNPLVLKNLKMLAAGDVPDLDPDLSVIPPHFTPDQRAHIEQQLSKHRKMTKVAVMELATTYSLLLGSKG